LDLAQIQYKAGLADFLTVLDSERTLAGNQNQPARAGPGERPHEPDIALQSAGRRMAGSTVNKRTEIINWIFLVASTSLKPGDVMPTLSGGTLSAKPIQLPMANRAQRGSWCFHSAETRPAIRAFGPNNSPKIQARSAQSSCSG
jgi:hypothetical protein